MVLDNLSVHESKEASAASARAGAEVLPLPSYSPDDNAIEELWTKARAIVRRIAARTNPGPYEDIAHALGRVTTRDMAGWFHHRGLYAMPV